jgi:hypothetical protein
MSLILTPWQLIQPQTLDFLIVPVLGMRLDRQRLKPVRVSALRGGPASILATVGET